MAKYRQLHTEFWSDGFVLDLTPEEKYFYLYLMTNPKTSQCGIYELPKRIIETETGYNRETIDKLLKRFIEYKKVGYCDDTKEIMLINWIKYNEPNNTNAIKCVNKELHKIKNTKFILRYYQMCLQRNFRVEEIFFDLENIVETAEGLYSPFQGALKGEGENINEIDESQEYQGEKDFNKPLTMGYEGTCKGLPSNRIRSNKEEVRSNEEKVINNKEEEKEVINKEKNDSVVTVDFTAVVKVFQNNIHPITPIEYDKLVDWTNEFSCEVIIMAIEEAVNYNARTMNYINKILNSWLLKGVKTLDDVMEYQKQWEKKKKRYFKDKNKGESVWDIQGQRKYDYKELEKKLLGWDEEDGNS